MEKEVLRYSIRVNWTKREINFLEMAKYVNSFFDRLSEIDSDFERIVWINGDKTKNIILEYPNIDFDLEFAEKAFNNEKYWIKKIMPNSRQDIYNFEYGNSFSFTTNGKLSETINFSLSHTNFDSNRNFLLIQFPIEHEKSIEYYEKILETSIEIFKPDYGSLYPNVISYLDPAQVTAGWISYFSEELNLPDEIFEGLIPRQKKDFILYFIESKHIYKKNESQFEKLKKIVEKFRKLKVKF